MIYLDIESVGFHGPTILIQWAEDDGPIHLHEVWNEPIQSTLILIEKFCDSEICGFNLSFDHFHLCQTYTTLILLDDKSKPPSIEEYASKESQARFGSCLKPKAALDLMLHARKGPYQNTMNRSDIKIRKVPTAIASLLVEELDKRIPLKNIYFAKKSDPNKHWHVLEVRDDVGDIRNDVKDVVCKFAPSSALKALCCDALDMNPILFGDIMPPKEVQPVEYGYAPFAAAVGSPENWNGAWPDVIEYHIKHWKTNEKARQYASDDVKYTRMLHYYFSWLKAGASEERAREEVKKGAGDYLKYYPPGNIDLIPPGDNDSELACMVGACRWRGYPLDIKKLKRYRQQAFEKVQLTAAKVDHRSHAVVRKYIREKLSKTEAVVMMVNGSITTKAIVLEELVKWRIEDVCIYCNGDGCNFCENTGLIKSEQWHPVAIRAEEILSARRADKEIELYDKLIRAGRFHPDFNVIGTLSSRMSGGSGLNAQGIKKTTEVRSCFPLVDSGYILCGGDYKGFEVVLMDAAYGDPVLHEELLSGRKIHGIFGMMLFPGMTYDEIIASDGLEGDKDKYLRSKKGVFALFYGGEGYTLEHRVGVSPKIAEEAFQTWIRKYKVWGQARKEIYGQFCSMTQPGGIGTKVEWAEPHDYIESMFGFRRYFTLENSIVKTLYRLANDTPKSWRDVKIKVTRRDREQTAMGATQSALYGAAFAVQASNMRAAANHVIQSAGAELTKGLQRRVWDHQPIGIGRWLVQPFNVHDEVITPVVPELVEAVGKTVHKYVEEQRPTVPLIGIDWHTGMASWAEK